MAKRKNRGRTVFFFWATLVDPPDYWPSVSARRLYRRGTKFIAGTIHLLHVLGSGRLELLAMRLPAERNRQLILTGGVSRRTFW
jgi:hypothetical protein